MGQLLAGCGGGADDARLTRPPPSTTAAPEATSSAPAASGSTAAPAPATTSPAPSAPEVVLGPDGLGVARFGDPAGAVLARLAGILGAPVDDRPLGSCPAGGADRLVQFAELGVVLAGEGAAQRFVAWDVGLASGAFPELRTADGVSVGSTLAEVRRAYPGAVEVIADDAFGPRLEVALAPRGSMGGTLTGTGPDATVVTLGAGEATCGVAAG